MVEQIPQFRTFNIEVSDLARFFVPIEHIEESLRRYRQKDFGILSIEDWQENLKVIEEKRGFVLGCYEFITPFNDIIQYWIVTDFDEEATKITLKDEGGIYN